MSLTAWLLGWISIFRGRILIVVISFHALAGLVAGSIFGVRTLLTMVALVLMESIGALIWNGFSVELLGALGSVVTVQVGYLGGICLRGVLERVGIGVPAAQPRRPPGI